MVIGAEPSRSTQKPDPLYDKIIARRRRSRRRLIGAALLILGASLLLAAFYWRSVWLALFGVAALAAAN